MMDDDIEVLRDEDDERRVELWTDGTWVRLGRDVESGRCVEFRIEQFDTVENNIRYFKTGAATFRLDNAGGYDTKYVVYGDHRPVVLDAQERDVVLVLGDDGWPLYTARSRALEERSDIAAEEQARGYIESLRQHIDIVHCNEVGLTGRVRMVLDEGTHNARLRFVDELRDSEVIEDPVELSCPENTIQYSFTVDTNALPR